MCSGESCLIELLGRGFKVASPYLQGEGLPQFIPSSDRTYVGASGNGSACCALNFVVYTYIYICIYLVCLSTI